MDKKVLFNESLTSLVEFAAVNNNHITMDDVKTHFKGLIDDDSQYQFIYDYLAVNKITIEGFEPSTELMENVTSEDDTTQVSNVAESDEELAFIDMYMDEISDILPINEDELNQLVSKLLSGDLSVVNRLVECHLHTVADIAKNFRGKGVTFGDLIQEGNIGLMVAISDYSENCGNFGDYVKKSITNTLDNVINSQVNSDRINQRLATKLNQLDTVTKDLNEKLGRVPEISELAEAMSITEEEASFLLKTSLDTLSVNEDTQITSDDDIDAQQDDKPSEDPLEWRVNKK